MRSDPYACVCVVIFSFSTPSRILSAEEGTKMSASGVVVDAARDAAGGSCNTSPLGGFLARLGVAGGPESSIASPEVSAQTDRRAARTISQKPARHCSVRSRRTRMPSLEASVHRALLPLLRALPPPESRPPNAGLPQPKHMLRLQLRGKSGFASARRHRQRSSTSGRASR